ncbi:hypothetical protein LAZ67_21001806 [Cordylochernes scorpioides]|uniref:Uncharacterized protein n=1 Tax=Cordylochernes scorpioides TaxID=51811 RepID=A0ABY6LQE0_9ARAC|nr:hypothetical protein LAZ67_21001806 [Cordylochernes scorpioides]
MPGGRRKIEEKSNNEATWCASSCCLKRSDCCLPPTPVYFLEDSLSPVLLLLSLTVLQLNKDSDIDSMFACVLTE